MKRKLVSIRTIDDISPIEGADMIVKCTVDGWNVVAKKGEFEVGDKCVFFEIDSFLPADDERFSFLKKSGTKKDPSGKERIRIRTVKLRKQLSQGLALPLSMFPEISEEDEGQDLSEKLNVIKYERPEPVQANASGRFPEYVPKTDEERIQNLYKKLSVKCSDVLYYPTLKLDGSSCTMIFLDESMKNFWNYEGDVPDDVEEPKSLPWISPEDGTKRGEFVVCSRNLALKYNLDSHFWKAVINEQLQNQMMDIHEDGVLKSFAIQGEVLGPGIQGNKERLIKYEFYAFNIYDVVDQQYLVYEDAKKIFEKYGIKCVPTLTDKPIQVFKEFKSLDEILEYADGPSLNNNCREGVVFKPAYDHDAISFKAISNRFLLKGGDE